MNIRLRKLSSLIQHSLGGLKFILVINRFFVVKLEGRGAVFFIIIILTAIIIAANFVEVRLSNLTHAPLSCVPTLKIGFHSNHAICQRFISLYILKGF